MPNAELEKFRAVAVKLHAFKVIEGLQHAIATVPCGDIDVQAYSGTTTRPAVAVIRIDDEDLAIFKRYVQIDIATKSVQPSDITIYRGPVKWLKGVVDYDGEEEDEK